MVKSAFVEPESVIQARLKREEQEHQALLDSRLRLLHPEWWGGKPPTMHVPLLPGRSVRMPKVDKRVVNELGLKTAVTTDIPVDYVGITNEEEFQNARMKGLVKFPGLWFTILPEEK